MENNHRKKYENFHFYSNLPLCSLLSILVQYQFPMLKQTGQVDSSICSFVTKPGSSSTIMYYNVKIDVKHKASNKYFKTLKYFRRDRKQRNIWPDVVVTVEIRGLIPFSKLELAFFVQILGFFLRFSRLRCPFSKLMIFF